MSSREHYPKCTDAEYEKLKRFPALTQKQVDVLSSTKYEDLHSTFNRQRPRRWLELYWKLVKQSRPAPPIGEIMRRDADNARIRQQQAELRQAYRHIAELRENIDAMAAVATAKRERIEVEPKRMRDGRIVKEAIAHVVIGDVHAAKSVRASQTNGYNTWNPDVCRHAFAALADSTIKMVVSSAATIPITELHIVSVGDLLENELRVEAAATNSMGVIDELCFVTGLIESYVDRVQSVLRKKVKSLKRVRVGFVWSNHDRITPKIEWSRLRETSMSYKVAIDIARRFESLDHVTVDWADSDKLITSPLGYKIRWHHGMSFRYQGGVGGITPSAMTKIARMNKGEKDPPILDVIGHWHHHTAPAGLYVNNCMCGYDPYAEGICAEKSPPSQGFFLIDSRYGYTLNTQLRVR